MISRLSTKNMTHEQWLAQRRKSIGGSDAGAVIGVNPFCSPYALWAEKTGKLQKEDISDKEAVRLGNDLEQYVAERFEEATGLRVRRDNYFVYNSDYPWAHVQLDRIVIGEDALLECKTTSSFDVLAKCRSGEYPDTWYAQTVHEMAVSGLKRAYLAVLCLGRGFFYFIIERDEAEINALMGAEKRFWATVEADTPPAVDGSESTCEALGCIYRGDDTDDLADLFGRDGLCDEYMLLTRQIKALTERKTEIENILKEDMRDATRGQLARYAVTWKPQTRKTFQTADFAADHPELDLSAYYKESAYRVFKMKEMKEIEREEV